MPSDPPIQKGIISPLPPEMREQPKHRTCDMAARRELKETGNAPCQLFFQEEAIKAGDSHKCALWDCQHSISLMEGALPCMNWAFSFQFTTQNTKHAFLQDSIPQAPSFESKQHQGHHVAGWKASS